MLRTIVVLGALFLAAAGVTDTYQDCALHSVAVVDELLDSSIYIWAAVERCGAESEAYRCEIDVASAVESVTRAMSIMVRALSECGALTHTECGEAAGHLTASLAGIAAASGQIALSCPAPAPTSTGPPPPPPSTGPCDSQVRLLAGLPPCAPTATERRLMPPTQMPESPESTQMPPLQIAMCTVDVKDSMRSIFQATRAFMTVKDHCKKGAPADECAQNVLKIVAAFGGMGGYLAGAVGHCSAGAIDLGQECGRAVAMLIKHLSIVADSGIAIHHECSSDESSRRRRRRRKSSSRLYEDDEEDVKDNWEEGTKEGETLGSKGVNLALVALLPITAFVSFAVGWKRHARRQQYEDLREVDVA